MLREFTSLGIVGGTIYDALLATCALKAKAATLFTWNIRHYGQFGPAVARILKTP
jgi:predicted nucleic acid-binding protein